VTTGGCLCGAVRYRASTPPSRTVACHCTFCQRATGSAFALWPVFRQDSLEIDGTLSTYETRSDESGRWIRLHFCPKCGTTIGSHWQEERGEIALLAGTFDDTSGVGVDYHVWTRSKQHWFELPPAAKTFPKESGR
jgi:hypothetical protein